MSATRWLLGAAFTAGLLLLVDVDLLATISANPRPALVFAAHWLTFMAYPSYLRRAGWFDSQNYRNITRFVIPVMAGSGACFGLAGIAVTGRATHALADLAASNGFFGVGVLGLVATLGLPLALSGHRSQRLHLRPKTAPVSIEEVIDRALELDAENQVGIGADALPEVAAVVDIPLGTMQQAARELAEPHVMQSHKPPGSQLKSDGDTTDRCPVV